MLFVCTPKFCISIVFSFSWPQEKLKTMLIQIFGVTKKEHYGMLWYFLEWSIAVPICKSVDLVRVLYLPVLFCTATEIHCCEIRYSYNSKTRLNGKISGLDENKHTGYVFLNLHKRPEKVPQSFAAHAGITFISCVFLEGDF